MRKTALAPDALRERRHALGLTQVQLAAALGVTPSTIARWEQGWNAIPELARRALDQLAAERSRK